MSLVAEFILSILAVSAFSVGAEAIRPLKSSPSDSRSRCSNANGRAQIELPGPAFLDDAPPLLVTLERRPRHREARDRHRLAPCRFPAYWRWRSRPRGGRPKITDEIRELIRRLAEENPDWGAPKIHGEMQKLGFVVSERTVARYLRRIQHRVDPGKRWLAFLQNHREVQVKNFFIGNNLSSVFDAVSTSAASLFTVTLSCCEARAIATSTRTVRLTLS